MSHGRGAAGGPAVAHICHRPRVPNQWGAPPKEGVEISRGAQYVCIFERKNNLAQTCNRLFYKILLDITWVLLRRIALAALHPGIRARQPAGGDAGSAPAPASPRTGRQLKHKHNTAKIWKETLKNPCNKVIRKCIKIDEKKKCQE
ncbi:hypothetical protein EVAR_97834_1 [Eumeta japonica]|uniref:Uncharacterized protein n=1 Tax=Eumeta variegata TaxID=151549 RepID=A0A4C1SH64_EUMVA|nr:hypothetical protein EVAR_97834_1 [Eumeta japonica]